MKLALALATLLLVPPLPATAATSNVCREEIKDAIYHTLHSGPYEMTSVMHTVTGDHRTVARIVPDVGIDSRTEIVGGNGINEFILIGDRFWQSYGDGWTEKPTAPGTFERAMSAQLLTDLNALVRPRCLGLVEIEGANYIGYSFGTEVPDITTESTFYVDPDTSLTARAAGRMVILGDLSTTITTFRYDSSIIISPPAL